VLVVVSDGRLHLLRDTAALAVSLLGDPRIRTGRGQPVGSWDDPRIRTGRGQPVGGWRGFYVLGSSTSRM
jgi:hypothetical protein